MLTFLTIATLLVPSGNVTARSNVTAAASQASRRGGDAEATTPQSSRQVVKGTRTRSLIGGYGHSWRHGWPGYGQGRTDVSFFAFHPQMGWFVTDRLELYGEATLLVYRQPGTEISAGVLPLAGRWHFRTEGRWLPYATLGGGILWTSLDVVEIDRTFNFQVVWGAGVRYVAESGPGWMVELRNHHISNAGTAPPNLGINAATVVGGLTWIRR